MSSTLTLIPLGHGGYSGIAYAGSLSVREQAAYRTIPQ
jgi:hypothetical protein